MPIDGLLFTALTAELDQKLRHARVQEVHQTGANQVYLQLRQPGQTLYLRMSAHPERAAIFLTESEPTNRVPGVPPPFCQVLRKHLIPGRIISVTQPPFERLLHVTIEGFDDKGERVERRLIVEVMGRHSNLILIDGREDMVLDAVRRIYGDVNRHREIAPNRPYVPPPPQKRANPLDATFETFDRSIRLIPAAERLDRALYQGYTGLSPFAAKEILARAGLQPMSVRSDLTPDHIDTLYRNLQELASRALKGDVEPTVVLSDDRDEFWVFPILTCAGDMRTFPSVNSMLDFVYHRLEHRERATNLHQRLNQTIDKHLKRAEKKASRQRKSLQQAADSDRFRLFGDLLTANLYRLQPGLESVSLPNYEADGELATIQLDPRLSPADNAQAYYRRYRRAKKTKKQAGQQLESTMKEIEYLTSVQGALDTCKEYDDLVEIEDELIREGYLDDVPAGRPKSAPKGPPQPMTFTSSDGFRIWVGRNNKQNDYLTMHLAKDDDLWLHVKDMPGAHVVISTQKGQRVPDSTIQEAAELAVLYSKAQHSSNVPVDYTYRRYVRKPKGARPGMVIYDHQQTLYITPAFKDAKRK